MAKEDDNKDKNRDSKNKNQEGEFSIDWFEDHESYDESNDDKEKEPEEDLTDEFSKADEITFDDDFNWRMTNFVINQRKDVSLEKMLELPEPDISADVPARVEEGSNDEPFDYLAKPGEDSVKYEVVEADTRFSRPDLSSAERILEEQKALYRHLESSSGGMVAKNESLWKPVTPEDTVKKDYISKKNFTTGPY
jgi:hypothetical protein